MPTLNKQGFTIYQNTLAEEQQGSYKTEVSSGNKKDTEYLAKLQTWYEKKLGEVNEIFSQNKDNDEIKQECYGKMLAYTTLVTKRLNRLKKTAPDTVDRTKKRLTKKELDLNSTFKNIMNNVDYQKIGITDEMVKSMVEFSSKKPEVQSRFISLDEEGNIDRIFTSEEIEEKYQKDNEARLRQEEKEKQDRESENREKERLAQERKEKEQWDKEKAVEIYKTELTAKANYITNLYNNGMSANFSVNQYQVRDAVREAHKEDSFFDCPNNKNLSILEKIDKFTAENITYYQNKINSEKSDKDYIFNSMKNVAFNDKVEIIGYENREDFNNLIFNEKNKMEAMHVGLSTNHQSLINNKLELYAATKKALDNRWFISKIFHPSRTRAENNKLQEIKADIKNTLKCDDSFFEKLDKAIKNPKNAHNIEFDTIDVTIQEDKIDLTQQVESKTQALQNKLFQSELSDITSEKVNEIEPSKIEARKINNPTFKKDV